MIPNTYVNVSHQILLLGVVKFMVKGKPTLVWKNLEKQIYINCFINIFPSDFFISQLKNPFKFRETT